MNCFKEFMLTPRKDIPHLNIFWRIVLAPIMFIWFTFQLILFSGIGGIVMIMLSFMSLLNAFGSLEWESEVAEAIGYIMMPIVSPFIWLFKYIYLGEYNTLFLNN